MGRLRGDQAIVSVLIVTSGTNSKYNVPTKKRHEPYEHLSISRPAQNHKVMTFGKKKGSVEGVSSRSHKLTHEKVQWYVH